MSIIIGADIVPTESNYSLFQSGDAEKLVGECLFKIISNADFRVFNLEVPLTDKKSPIKKSGPCLIAPTSTSKGLSDLRVDLVTLANNHIMDQGEYGLKSTCKSLAAAGIDYVGVGNNCIEARKPYYKTIKGKTVCVYACVEHEFSVADNEHSGANGFNALTVEEDIKSAKSKCDYLIVLYHGGKEHYRYPSPDLQKICRFIVDGGADLVICQHSHCIGCLEEYHLGKIIYGQGNFLFDHQNNEFWNTSLLIRLNDRFDIEYIPIVREGCTTRLASSDEADLILKGFKDRSSEIKIDGFVEERYREFASKHIYDYLRLLNGKKNLLYRILNKLSGHKLDVIYSNRKYRKQNLIDIENIINCEAHRELLIQGLRELELKK